MAKLSLEDFDKHIENLRAQLLHLNGTLEGTDHHGPEWLATDLLSLRNKSGRLQDDMKLFRDKLESEGLAEKAKTSNKRFSLEGAKFMPSTPTAQDSTVKNATISSPAEHSATPIAKSTHVEDTYVVQHVDVTEEVNRRLRENRFRRLMETPSTAQKRKYNAYDEPMLESAGETEEDETASRSGYSGSEYETPTKRLKSSGIFGRAEKRKENGHAESGFSELPEDSSVFKRRRM